MAVLKINAQLSVKLRVLSFLSTFFVLLQHSPFVNPTGIDGNVVVAPLLTVSTFIETFVSQGLVRVNVPFFFMCSAFFLFRDFELTWKWAICKWRSRVNSLVIPYVGWCLFCACSWLALLLAFGRPLGVTVDTSLVFKFLGLSTVPIKGEHLWFLQVLIVYVAMAPAIGWITQKCRWGLIFLGLLFLFCPGFPKSVHTASLFYFASGAGLAFHSGKGKHLNGLSVLLLLGAWIALLTLRTALICCCGIESYTLLHFSVIVGLVAMWKGYDWLSLYIHFNDNHLYHYSFFVYCSHLLVMGYLGIMLKHVFGFEPGPFLYWLVFPCLTLASCLIFGYSLRRLCPRVFSVMTGGR